MSATTENYERLAADVRELGGKAEFLAHTEWLDPIARQRLLMIAEMANVIADSTERRVDEIRRRGTDGT